MQTRTDLVESSLKIIRSGQTASGAFLACPTFAVYRYSWFRDGTFIAQALDLWGDQAAAGAFYQWGVDVILRHRTVAQQAVASQTGGVPQTFLHTRYLADGTPAEGDWPNFQLDGFGTFLWGLHDHIQRSSSQTSPHGWTEAVTVVADYLCALWRLPNYDCWEEFPDEVHVSTLCALYGGLRSAALLLGHREAAEIAPQIRSLLDDLGRQTGYLPKMVGSRDVDGALLWACIPFDVYAHDHPLVVATVRKIEADLLGDYGGVHRYAADSYYGGGEWVLLTALYGEYLMAAGDRAGALQVWKWIERQASGDGELPEQVARDLNVPEMFDPWVERWGLPAQPLLWSHAAYLRLRRIMSTSE